MTATLRDAATWIGLVLAWSVQYTTWVPLVWAWRLTAFALRAGLLGVMLLCVPIVGWVVLAVMLLRRPSAERARSNEYLRPWGCRWAKKRARQQGNPQPAPATLLDEQRPEVVRTPDGLDGLAGPSAEGDLAGLLDTEQVRREAHADLQAAGNDRSAFPYVTQA